MTLELGDHLWVKKSLYTHHGIYVGNNKVIHYSGLAAGLQSGPVCKTTLAIFSGNEKVNKRSYKNTKYKPKEVVSRVKNRIGEKLYSVHSNNCEHFCCWAITGNHASEQVEIFESVIGYINPVGEIVSNLKTLGRGIRTGDKEIMQSSSINTAKTVGEQVALRAVVAIPVVGQVIGLGYLAQKLYRKIKN